MLFFSQIELSSALLNFSYMDYINQYLLKEQSQITSLLRYRTYK